jgi:hypothetical protein
VAARKKTSRKKSSRKKSSRKKAGRKKGARKKTARKTSARAKRDAEKLLSRINSEVKDLTKEVEKRLKPLQKEIEKAERKAGTQGARLLREARKRLNDVDLQGGSDMMSFLRKRRSDLSKAITELEGTVRPHRKQSRKR